MTTANLPATLSAILSTLTDHDPLAGLDEVERAIARSYAFEQRNDVAGRRHVVVSADLLALAEREHAITEEFKRRRTGLSTSMTRSADAAPDPPGSCRVWSATS